MKPVIYGWRTKVFLCLTLSSVLIIAGLFMSSAEGEYVIHIRVINETDEFQNIIVFQQDDELGLMFEKVFPMPWQVFPLPGRGEGVERKGTAEFPFSQQIGVTRDIDASCALLNKIISLGRRQSACTGFGTDSRRSGLPVEMAIAAQRNKEIRKPVEGISALPFMDRAASDHLLRLASVVMGKLFIKTAALNGDKFKYFLDVKGGQHIVKLSDRNKDGSITCRNISASLVNVDFYKNDTKVAVWPLLANGDEARFLLKRKISFSYDNDLKSGDMIRTRIEGDRVATVELAGYSMIEARLVYDLESPGKLKKWIITKQ